MTMPANDATPPADLTRMRTRMQWCVAVVMLGFVAAIYLHYWITAYEGGVYPPATYLYRPQDTMGVAWEGVSSLHCFGDLYGQWLVARLPTPYVMMPWGQGSNYLPFTHVLMLPSRLLPYWAVLPLFLAATAGGCFWFCYRALERLEKPERVIAATALALMSYPVQILLDRGNVEAFVFAFLAGFHLLYTARRPHLAAASLAAAIAIKGYPAVFGLVFLNRGQVRPLLLCGALAALLTLASAGCFAGGVIGTLQACLAGMAQYASTKVSDDGIACGSSLWGLMAITAYLTSWAPEFRDPLLWLVQHFKIMQVAIAAGLVVVFSAVRFRLWEALSLCCFAMMSLLAVGPDYRLVHWLIPTAAFCASNRAVRWPRAYAVLLGLLLIPKGLVIAGEVKLSAFFNPLIMLVICGMVVTEAVARHSGTRPYVLVLHQLRNLPSSLSRLASRTSPT
jgi:hypothetical protein